VSERSLGDKWAERERARGAYVLKLPASSTAGIPDWLHVVSGQGAGLVEAKLALHSRRDEVVYRPEQLTRAQRFILRMVGKHGGRAQVLVLASGGYVVLDWREMEKPLGAAKFHARMEEW
jgi:hypothetical protein